MPAPQVRKDIVQYLRENPKCMDFDTKLASFLEHPVDGSDWNAYLRSMSKKETHGDHLTLLAAARYFEAQIIVFSSNKLFPPTVIAPNKLSELKPANQLPIILLGHYEETAGEHYVSLRPESEAAFAEVINSLLQMAKSSNGKKKSPIGIPYSRTHL